MRRTCFPNLAVSCTHSSRCHGVQTVEHQIFERYIPIFSNKQYMLASEGVGGTYFFAMDLYESGVPKYHRQASTRVAGLRTLELTPVSPLWGRSTAAEDKPSSSRISWAKQSEITKAKNQITKRYEENKYITKLSVQIEFCRQCMKVAAKCCTFEAH